MRKSKLGDARPRIRATLPGRRGSRLLMPRLVRWIEQLGFADTVPGLRVDHFFRHSDHGEFVLVGVPSSTTNRFAVLS